MQVIKSGGHIIGARFTEAENKAIEMEIKTRRLPKYLDELEEQILATILFSLRESFGFGDTRCDRFVQVFHANYQKLVQTYEMNAYEYVCLEKLKESGYDVHARLEEMYKP